MNLSVPADREVTGVDTVARSISSGLITILRVLAVPTLKSAPESYKPRPAPF